MPLAAIWMNLEIVILCEISQTKTNIIYHFYVEPKEMIQMNLFINRNGLTGIGNKHGYQRRKWGGFN